jgi:hypothetical protein
MSGRRRPAAERAVGAVVHAVAAIPGARAVLLSPVVAVPGFWVATGCAALWGRLLGGRFRVRNGVRYFEGLPRWAYGRGGTTIGAVYLTTDNTAPGVLDHEAVHVEQWRRYGLAFIPLYIAAGADALANRFEIEAGLERGGYLPARRPRPRRS